VILNNGIITVGDDELGSGNNGEGLRSMLKEGGTSILYSDASDDNRRRKRIVTGI
jgi:hypothetical protein